MYICCLYCENCFSFHFHANLHSSPHFSIIWSFLFFVGVDGLLLLLLNLRLGDNIDKGDSNASAHTVTVITVFSDSDPVLPILITFPQCTTF